MVLLLLGLLSHSQKWRTSNGVTHFRAFVLPGCNHCLKWEEKCIKIVSVYVQTELHFCTQLFEHFWLCCFWWKHQKTGQDTIWGQWELKEMFTIFQVYLKITVRYPHEDRSRIYSLLLFFLFILVIKRSLTHERTMLSDEKPIHSPHFV